MMATLGRVGAWFRRLAGSPPKAGFRLVRRVDIHCPHGRGLVTVDMVTDAHGVPDVVLRCAGHEACPPACDQPCLRCTEAVRTPATALVVYPSGRGPDDVAD